MGFRDVCLIAHDDAGDPLNDYQLADLGYLCYQCQIELAEAVMKTVTARIDHTATPADIPVATTTITSIDAPVWAEKMIRQLWWERIKRRLAWAGAILLLLALYAAIYTGVYLLVHWIF